MADYNRLATITRQSFADYIDRYADGRANAEEWNHFAVQHYGDYFLEEMRRCIVRLARGELPIQAGTDAARNMLRSWAFLLRASTNAATEYKPDVAAIEMTPSEAVVLDAIVRRYSESNTLTVENPAEQQCLWNVQCILEKHGDRPDWPSLRDATDNLLPGEI